MTQQAYSQDAFGDNDTLNSERCNEKNFKDQDAVEVDNRETDSPIDNATPNKSQPSTSYDTENVKSIG